MSQRKTTKQFIWQAQAMHYGFFGYSKVDYINNSTKVEIECPIHGSFWQMPVDHLRGFGCLDCGNSKTSKSHDLFVQQVRSVHKDRITIIGKYKSKRTKIEIKCNNCGSEHLTMPKGILDGNACDKCRQSKGEIGVSDVLIDNKIKFETQWNFNKHKQLRGLGSSYLLFDFYLPKYNLCIEYDGKQHFKSIARYGGYKGFVDRQNNDQLKNQFCLDNNIKLLRIPYWVNPTEELILQYLEDNFTVANTL